ncbi:MULTISPECIES: hypothetical protein [Cyanophyceae]|uniref:hypothetical protein n=1 Tax=Cyanophyceae TaxID=3028117 RepID=UPI00168317F0|nr:MULTISPECIES: hypothetical protein [Cyanophyceae]MBD1917551.1 hypothetical protein [Phormidium sp. FACHB-77]MBD2029574.1 hypothetical protein [Phormidium sp. FACHB-322]MBD2050835.1 hypothetical protein [Leptolyngbya sp. FACHB-60]
MVVVVFIGAGLLAFGLSFWLTRRLQRPRPAAKQKAPVGLQRRSLQNRSSSPSFQNPLAGSPAPDLDRQVHDLLGQGRLVDAVKRVREVNGCSLNDAKAYVAERLP